MTFIVLDSAPRFFRFSLGVLLVLASGFKLHAHSHSIPQLSSGWLEYPAVSLISAAGEMVLGAVLLSGFWSPVIRRIAIAIFAVFVVVSTTEAVVGTKSCGCFGSEIHIPPFYTAMFDLAVVVSLLFSDTKASTSPKSSATRKRQTAVATAIIVAGTATAAVWEIRKPVIVVAQATPDSVDADPFGKPGELTLLEPEKLAGKPFLLATHIDIGPRLLTGQWVVMLVHHDCDVCVGAVPKYQSAAIESGAPKLAIIEIPPYGAAGEPPPWPTGAGTFGKLDTSRDWFATTPAALLVKDGIVEVATADEQAATPDPIWFSRRRQAANAKH